MSRVITLQPSPAGFARQALAGDPVNHQHDHHRFRRDVHAEPQVTWLQHQRQAVDAAQDQNRPG